MSAAAPSFPDLVAQVRSHRETIAALARCATTRDEADWLITWADSYLRLDTVMCAWRLPPLDWFQLLGKEWSGCDNICEWRTVLRRILRDASRNELDAMMEPAEGAALAALPETITVFRGCYRINRTGLSWTLERSVAERFPFMRRYSRVGEQPLLLTGTVRRDRVVLKLDRNEYEIIAANVKVTATAQLTTGEDNSRPIRSQEPIRLQTAQSSQGALG